MVISDAPLGVSFRVGRILLAGEAGRRLVDMGFTQGAEGRVIRRGLFGGPLQLRIRGCDVLIRRSEASGVEVADLDRIGAARIGFSEKELVDAR